METFNYSINKVVVTNKISHIPENLSKFAYVKLKTSEASLNKEKEAKFVILKEKLLEFISGKQKTPKNTKIGNLLYLELEKANDLMNKF